MYIIHTIASHSLWGQGHPTAPRGIGGPAGKHRPALGPLRTDHNVLSDYAYCDQALSLPICTVQCARSAPYVSVILKFALKGNSSGAPRIQKIGHAGLRFLVSYTFYFVCWCWNLILFCHLLNVKCVFSELPCLCLWLAVLHAPSKKVWPPSAAEVQKLLYS